MMLYGNIVLDHQAITWTNVDLSLMGFCDPHLTQAIE